MVPDHDLSTLVITVSVWEYRSSRKVVLQCKSPDPRCADTETNWCCRMEWEWLTRLKGRNAVAEQVSCVHVCTFPFHAFLSLCGSMYVNMCTE